MFREDDKQAWEASQQKRSKVMVVGADCLRVDHCTIRDCFLGHMATQG